MRSEVSPDETSHDNSEQTNPHEQMDAVYRDRNLLACAFAELAPMGGWTPAPDYDPEEWAIVHASTPMGQVSWHVPREMAASLVTRDDDYEWDGHSRDVKNDRLASWAEEGCWY